MKQSQLGVLREDPHDDVRALIENYTGEFRLLRLLNQISSVYSRCKSQF
jgi:hypothetical protein